ncbi:MAG TPA: hypothetical protein VNZ86_15990 [Bacteroidia bacterium]|nr:hypothetical protein [Bacteroidia bacterium]
MKAFFIKLSLFSGCCAAGLFSWNRFTDPGWHDNLSWYILGFFTLSTGLVHQYLLRSASGEAKNFVYKFMGITGIKLFSYLSFLIILFLLNRNHARILALYFLVMYLLFTVFEVSSLYRKLKK